VVRFQNAEMLTPHGTMTHESWFKLLCEKLSGEAPTDPINPKIPEWSLNERVQKIVDNTSETRPEWRQSLSRPQYVITGLVELAGQTVFGDDDIFTIAESRLSSVPSEQRFDVATLIDNLLQVACRAMTIHDIETGAGVLADLLEATGFESLIRVLEHRGPAGGAETPAEPSEAPAEAPPASIRETEEELDYITFRLIDAAGEPVIGAKYQIELPDGQTLKGTIQDANPVELRDIPSGDCTITFPELAQSIRSQ